MPADAEHLGQAKRSSARCRPPAAPKWCRRCGRRSPIPTGSDGNYVRQVVFLTDGAIGNEQQLFETISALRGRSRIFMVGIGSAPNTFLMTRAAELGRGTFTHIGSVEQVEERMRGLFAKLENPAVTDLTATSPTPRPTSRRRRSPTSIAASRWCSPPSSTSSPARSRSRAGSATGRGSSRCRSPMPPKARACRSCGRGRKIADAEVARTTRQATPEDADKTILALALEHQLVTRLTSLVAVDKTPSRPEGETLKLADLPLNLPAGWDFDKVFGERPKTAGNAGRTARRCDEARVQVAALKEPPPGRGRAGHGHAAEDRDRCRTAR